MHDALCWLTYLTEEEVQREAAWPVLVHDLITQRRLARSGHLIVAVERIPMLRAVFPTAVFDADVAVPGARAKEWARDEALREIVRGRLEGLGPTNAGAIATSLGVEASDVDAALLALEAEGSAMRGNFEPENPVPVQWCDRRLLARVHRYTVKRLRAEIEPVQARDFLRFLFEWQRVTPSTRMQGPDAVPAVLGQLEGFDAPASAWETEVLPARIAEYDPAWLDEQCLAGRIVWTRLATRAGDAERGAAPVRSTPIALLARRNARLWSSLVNRPETPQLTPKAQQVSAFIQEHGASFYDEIVEGAHLLPTQVEEALAELVALGLVNSDSFGGLRALLVRSDRRRPNVRDARRKRRMAIFGMQDAGRWALVKKGAGAESGEDIEHVCRTLLRRWGVVFWKLLEREADWLPPWRQILMCLRRLEARGEIRGGRFVQGFSGEQFALPDAVGLLRDARRKPNDGEFLSLSAADPLNLVGVITPGARLPSLTGNRVLYRDGLPIAVYAGGEVAFLELLEEKEQWQARNALLRRQVPAPLADLA